MVPMPASRRYHHGDLRAALLKSAERTLRDKGAAALSLRELARDIGVSHAAPGRHFKDKQALLDALALAGYERLLRDLTTADSTDRPVDERVRTLARAYLGFAIDNPALLELMFARKHEPDSSDRLAAAVEESFGSLTRIITDAQARGEIVEGDPERIMMVVASSVHGIAAFVAGCALTPEEALAGLDEQVHHLLYGLRPR
ncbi:WHG domain-containing protein [Streptomyces actuosus]|uniref:WHG domain-containing protein n=1 Tax=Streptomyces actuosus TaxID=1885 RepID=A0ABS2VQ07_STRAS|nr:TetR/AcrR family transcriptional regulator [Streptomyces actuosus]MBN0045161.1 WHG domain-containing protein [Streptomyces actuosus]